jgi:putative tricarboxylic transport membrane protein
MKKMVSLCAGCLMVFGLFSAFAGGSSENATTVGQSGTWQPTKDVEYIIPASPGGGSDLWARAISNAVTANKLSNVTWVPINKPGGASAVGYNYLLTKKGDPHAIFAMNSGPMVSTYVAGWEHTFEGYMDVFCILAYDEVTLCTLATGPYKDIQTLLKTAQEKPGTLRYGSDQRLNDSHYACELLKKYCKADFNYVQYDSSGDAATALLGGHVDVAILNPSECIGQVNAGQFIPVVSFSTERMTGKFANTPTFTEIGYPQLVLRGFRGISGALDMPDAAKRYYEQIGKKLLDTPEFKQYLSNNLLTPTFMGLDEAPAYSTNEMKKIAALFNEVLGGDKKK